MALVEKLNVQIEIKGMDQFKKDITTIYNGIKNISKHIDDEADNMVDSFGKVGKKISTITSQLTKLNNKKTTIKVETEEASKATEAMNASALATAVMVTNLTKFGSSSKYLSIYFKDVVALRGEINRFEQANKANTATLQRVNELMKKGLPKENIDGYEDLIKVITKTEAHLKKLYAEMEKLNNKNARSIKIFKQLKGMASGITSFFKTLAIRVGALALTIGILVNGLQRLTRATVDVASDIQESQNVVEVAFGDSADAVKEWARTLLYSYGLSENTALRAVGQFQQMGVSMGLTSNQAAIMSKSLTELTGDVASFLNLSQDRVQLALTGIYTGETEALKRLNVAMTQHNIEAFMMSKGVNKSFTSLSQAEKVAWRYRYVMESLALAQGDVNRTSNSYANIMRRLRGMIEQARKEIGEGLLIVFYRMLPTIEALVRRVYVLALAFKQLMGRFGEVPRVASNAGDGFAGIGDAINDATAANNKFRRSLAGFDELNVIADPPTTGDTGFDDIGAALEGMGDVDWLADLNDELAITQEEIDAMANALLAAWEVFKAIGVGLAGLGILVWVWKLIEGIKWLHGAWVLATTKGTGLNIILGYIAKAFGAVFTWVGAVVALFVGGFIYMWNTSELFKGTMIDVWNAVKEAVMETWETYKIAFGKMIDLFQPLIDFIKKLIIWILEIAGILAGIFLAIIAGIIIGVAKILTWAINHIGNFFEWLNGIIKSVIDWVKDFAARTKSAFGNFKENMNNLKTLAWGVVESMKKSFANFRSYITDAFNRVVQTIKNKISDIKDALKNMFNTYIKRPKFRMTGSLNPIDWATKGLPRLHIDWLARGGMVQAGGLFMAGESGAELIGSHQGRTTVMPLEETNFIAAMENAMVNGMMRAIEASGTNEKDIVIKVGEIELGRATERGLNTWSNLQGGLGVSF